MKFAVIGAGNGGQAIAGFLAMIGYEVNLYDRDVNKIKELSLHKTIQLTGVIKGVGELAIITHSLEEAVSDVDIIMVTTTANAHKELASVLAPIIKKNQSVILNPGRTCGAIEFKKELQKSGCRKIVYIAEAQTLVYACRLKKNGIVNIIGVKDEVLLSALPSRDTLFILEKLNQVYPCFKPAENVLRTSLENIGAIFHPCVVLFNAATIERESEFYFYRDMTPKIASFIEKFDAERIAVGKAYGIDLINVNEWISFAYKGVKGTDLCEKLRNNPAYYDILAPSTIYARQLLEDIPTGVLPILELGKAAGIEMPLFESMINICTSLLSIDFRKEGRSLKNLGLSGFSKEEILNYIN